jgi:hypothetical protein
MPIATFIRADDRLARAEQLTGWHRDGETDLGAAGARRRQGHSYRTIAVVLFGLKHISERAWKTHDLRSRTIRR